MQTELNGYFDYAATTPLDPRVLEAMIPYFSQVFGNPSSIHTFGQAAEAGLESARENLAADLNCRAEEIIFTSGGTESDNLAVRGTALARRREHQSNHILVTPVEHPAVSNTVRQLSAEFGFEVELLPVDRFGRVDPQDVARRIREDTALVSVIYANNEIGSINPISEIGEICRIRGVPLHSDAVQAGAYLELDVQRLKVDLLSLGAHKFYGPKGVGTLYLREGTDILATQTGGGQEFGKRAGTQNIPYIIGMAEAFHLAQVERSERISSVRPLRDRIIGEVLEAVPESQLTGHPEQRLPNHASFVFKNVDGNALLILLDSQGFGCSSGSACKTGDPAPSGVLLALGLEPELALGSLRITLGRGSSPEGVQALIEALPEAVSRARRW